MLARRRSDTLVPDVFFRREETRQERERSFLTSLSLSVSVSLLSENLWHPTSKFAQNFRSVFNRGEERKVQSTMCVWRRGGEKPLYCQFFLSSKLCNNHWATYQRVMLDNIIYEFLNLFTCLFYVSACQLLKPAAQQKLACEHSSEPLQAPPEWKRCAGICRLKPVLKA